MGCLIIFEVEIIDFIKFFVGASMVQNVLPQGIGIWKSCSSSLTPSVFFTFVKNNCCGMKLKAILYKYYT